MESDFIVLNSITNICKALQILQEYGKTVCVLDNDAAGRNAFALLYKALNGNAEDMSSLYNGFKDLNDYLKGG